MNNNLFFILVFFLILQNNPVVCQNQGISAHDIPNPTIDYEKCGRPRSSMICNPNGIISNSVADWFDQEVAKLYNQTQTDKCGGYQVASAVINKMVLNGGENSEQAVARYGIYLMNKWGVGDASCNTGVMLFISIDDRKLTIITGMGAKEKISESTGNNIIGTMKPYFKRNDYNNGFERGVEEIRDYLLGVKKPLDIGIVVMVALFSFAGLIALIAILIAGVNIYQDWERKKRDKERNEFKEKFQRIKEGYNKGSFGQEDCVICLELFEDLEKESNYESRVLSCGHRFCTNCLDNWWNRPENKKYDNTSLDKEQQSNVDDIEIPNRISSSDDNIEEGLRRIHECPICRKRDVDDKSRETSTSSSRRKNRSRNNDNPELNHEARFRSESLSYLFPIYLMMSSVNSWNPSRGFNDIDPFYLNNTTSHNNYSSSSNNTSSNYHHTTSSTGGYSFGGGSSFGGGVSVGGW